MDIIELQNEAKRAFDHALAKKNLQQRMEARLNVSYNNGFFTVTKEQLCFLHLMHSKEIVLLDDYQVPIRVNALELYTKMSARYHEIMNEWAEEYEQLKSIRTAKNV